MDRWAHSVPHVDVREILSSVQHDDEPDVRSESEEGGRIAISGQVIPLNIFTISFLNINVKQTLQNGWAFFDYHLAFFGPQELPLGPHR